MAVFGCACWPTGIGSSTLWLTLGVLIDVIYLSRTSCFCFRDSRGGRVDGGRALGVDTLNKVNKIKWQEIERKKKKNGPAVSNVTLSVDSINWCGYCISNIYLLGFFFFLPSVAKSGQPSHFFFVFFWFFCSFSGWSKSRSDCAHYVNGKEEGSISTGFCKNSTSAIVFVFCRPRRRRTKNPLEIVARRVHI